jgi:hypothetical protein
MTLSQAGGPTKGTISGTVTSSSGATLGGAKIASGSLSTASQANGSYILANVNPGTVTLTASLAGYQTGTHSVTVTAAGTATANFVLTPANSPTGMVNGKVSNISNGMALSGTTVKWSTTAVSTNSTGSYVLNNVNSGTQTITASASGYLSRSFTVNVTGGSTSTLNFPLATAGIIKVVALNSTGAADAGATVTIQGGVIRITVTGITNSSGTYSSNWIPVGSFTINISQTGHTTQSKSATVTAGVTTTVNFTF